MIREGWYVRVIVPAGTSWTVAGAEASFFRPGLLGMLDYDRAIRRLSHDVDAVLIVANNPAMVQGTSASARPDKTFFMFLSPLNSLNVIREMASVSKPLSMQPLKAPYWPVFLTGPKSDVS